MARRQSGIYIFRTAKRGYLSGCHASSLTWGIRASLLVLENTTTTGHLLFKSNMTSIDELFNVGSPAASQSSQLTSRIEASSLRQWQAEV